jgi:hypothetical protein
MTAEYEIERARVAMQELAVPAMRWLPVAATKTGKSLGTSEHCPMPPQHFCLSSGSPISYPFLPADIRGIALIFA